ncbi:hypothetical protein LSG31_09015 [Fodinisporobacter ferrooxydans]|uniref:Uncharacterized protein n=1 Tax=Fodinisporobacter ferrooxydans TaxID=2901836 RepID=A0ABY4CRN9_9BACL|nr:hypothetical protein LSG31_09015 [Alicyclobacillaceae bacterium MYW30-H2]
MKKLMIGLVAAGLITGLGTAAYAETPPSNDSIQNNAMQQFSPEPVTQNAPTGPGATNAFPSFEQMLPYMKQMHPNITDQQFKAMYAAMQSMMNGSNGQMMGGNYGQNGSGGMMGNWTPQTPQVPNSK